MGNQVQEVSHPSSDVVLEELRQVLVVEVVKDARDLHEGTEDHFQRHLQLK
jgi:hypothetical protein